MLLLSADTSGKQGSIALAHAEPAAVQILEVVPLAGGTFSAQLIPQIAALLSQHRFTKKDIGGFVVASGPGSFTGLRVGLAGIKALAEILQKPIAAVSLLEAVAIASGRKEHITTLLDAGRGELYVGEYEVSEDRARSVAERIMKREEFQDASHSPVITPDKAVSEFLAIAGTPVTLIPAIDAGTIVSIGYKKIEAGETVFPEQLEANYIRRSDAEIFAKPRH